MAKATYPKSSAYEGMFLKSTCRIASVAVKYVRNDQYGCAVRQRQKLNGLSIESETAEPARGV